MAAATATATATVAAQPTTGDGQKKRPHIVFVHLDLGIGGAEQLVVNLALASLGPSTPGYAKDTAAASSSSLDAKVSIYTTHRSPTHCFDAVKPPDGVLSSSVQVRGAALPVNVPLFFLFGPRIGTALCSAIRMVYLTRCAAKDCKDADVFVVDVLPTGLPMLVCWWMARSALFYCHFPDKLLTRDTVNGVAIAREYHQLQRGKSLLRALKSIYRSALDSVEERTMRYADLIAVNSNFTRGEVSSAFPTLKASATGNIRRVDGDTDKDYIKVLYPPIDLEKFIKPDFDAKVKNIKAGKVGPIFSLNRFERKKNVGILLHAYAKLREKKLGTKAIIPNLVIAGGYDPRNTENTEHLIELKRLAADLNIQEYASFLPSVGDDERAELLRGALCVVYTPHREHFGIVPLEAMYAGSPVIAVNSGGPKETVVHDSTGLLVDNTVEGFASALEVLVQNPTKAVEMGRNGHKRIASSFGLDTFRAQWADIVMETMRRGDERTRRWKARRDLESKRLIPLWLAYIAEMMVTLLAVALLTYSLKAFGLINADVWGKMKRLISRSVGDNL